MTLGWCLRLPLSSPEMHQCYSDRTNTKDARGRAKNL